MTDVLITDRDIEDYIDKLGMVHLLTLIENICLEKAENLASDWQDRAGASAWRRGSRRIYKAAQFEDWPL